MNPTTITATWLCSWLDHLGYPLPQPGGPPVLVLAEGAIPRFDLSPKAHHWPSPAPGASGDILEGGPDTRIVLQAVENILDQFNDAGLLLWRRPHNGALGLGAFYGSVNPGSVLSGRSGWPQLGDGAHFYEHSFFRKVDEAGNVVFDRSRPALRSARNRCFREGPLVTGQGGDGVLTLSEVSARGMYANDKILGHPGRKATYSAGCWLTSGTYADAAWRSVWGHSEAGLWVVRHQGANLLQWIRAGGPGHVPPILRPGANTLRWMRPLQRALGVSPDGVYGPQVAAALLLARTQQGIDRATAERSEITWDDWRRLGAQVAA